MVSSCFVLKVYAAASKLITNRFKKRFITLLQLEMKVELNAPP